MKIKNIVTLVGLISASLIVILFVGFSIFGGGNNQSNQVIQENVKNEEEATIAGSTTMEGEVIFEQSKDDQDPAILSSVELKTGSGKSPAWLSLMFEVQGTFNAVDFEYDFKSDAQGILSAHLDGVNIFTADEIYALDGVNKSHPIQVGDKKAGIHNLTLRLDPTSEIQSVVEIYNVTTGTFKVKIE